MPTSDERKDVVPAVADLPSARVFPTHRAMIAEIVRLKEAGEIEAYSIHAVSGGVAAGVQIAGVWSFLAEDSVQ